MNVMTVYVQNSVWKPTKGMINQLQNCCIVGHVKAPIVGEGPRPSSH